MVPPVTDLPPNAATMSPSLFVDWIEETAENTLMETANSITSADATAVVEHALTGKPLDADILRRWRAEGDRLREKVLSEHGLVDSAVPAIREFRGKLAD
jgi:hypothetical protein